MFDKLLNLFRGQWFGPVKSSKTNKRQAKNGLS